MGGKKKIVAFILGSLISAGAEAARQNGVPVSDDFVAWIVSLAGAYILGESSVDIARTRSNRTRY